jgi:hypothetical protein
MSTRSHQDADDQKLPHGVSETVALRNCESYYARMVSHLGLHKFEGAGIHHSVLTAMSASLPVNLFPIIKSSWLAKLFVCTAMLPSSLPVDIDL